MSIYVIEVSPGQEEQLKEALPALGIETHPHYCNTCQTRHQTNYAWAHCPSCGSETPREDPAH